MSKIQGFSAVPITRAQSAIDNFKLRYNTANQLYKDLEAELKIRKRTYFFGLFSESMYTYHSERSGWEYTKVYLAKKYPEYLTVKQAEMLTNDDKSIHSSLKALIETTTEDNVLCNPTICKFIVEYSDKS